MSVRVFVYLSAKLQMNCTRFCWPSLDRTYRRQSITLCYGDLFKVMFKLLPYSREATENVTEFREKRLLVYGASPCQFQFEANDDREANKFIAKISLIYLANDIQSGFCWHTLHRVIVSLLRLGSDFNILLRCSCFLCRARWQRYAWAIFKLRSNRNLFNAFGCSTGAAEYTHMRVQGDKLNSFWKTRKKIKTSI